MPDVNKIRQDFPILKRRRVDDGKPFIYLDNAATSLKPIQVIEAVVNYYEQHCANIHRGVHTLSQEASQLYEEAHDKVAKFIGAKNREEIVFVKNTTEAINYIAYGLNWKPGDEIITTVMEHHSNIVPWQLIRDRFGVKIKFLDLKDKCYLNLEQLEDLITEKTKLVTVVHVSNVLGTINPVEEICKIAHEHEIPILIDGAQAVPHLPVDVKKIKCEFLAFSVTGDTPLLTMIDDKVMLMPIKNVIAAIKNGKKVYVLTLDRNTKLVFGKVTGWLEHEDEVYEVKYEGCGIPLKMTGYHSVFVWEKGKIVPKKVKELKPNDFLITFNAKSCPAPLSSPEIELTYMHHGNRVVEKIEITEDLMRLIGYYLAEGSLTKGNYRIQFTFGQHEIDYINDCMRIIRKLEGTRFYVSMFREVQKLRNLSLNMISKKTGLSRKTVKKYLETLNGGVTLPYTVVRKVKVHMQRVKNRADIYFNSKKWFEFFRQFCGTKQEKHLPSFVWKLPKKYVLEMLRGYIRGDGAKSDPYNIRVKSVVKDLIVEFCWLLKLNGISCTIIKRKDGIYELVIQRSELEGLEFSIKRKKKDAPRDKTLPVDELRVLYKQLRPKYNTKVYMTIRNEGKRAPKEEILKVIKWILQTRKYSMDTTSTKIIETYKTLINGDIGVVKVKSVVKRGKETVYDVSVEEYERFFGGTYPVLLHNSAHKMLGPTGVGALYIREGLGEEMCPTFGGGDMIRRVTLEKSEWNVMPWKFEAGTPNIAGGIGFGAAVEYLEKLGMEWVRNHEKELTRYLLERLHEIPKVTVYGPEDVEKRGGVVAFTVEGLDSHEVAMYLDELENIAIRSGVHCAEPLHMKLGIPSSARASVYIYNTKEEIDIFCSTLEKVIRELT